MNKIIVIFIQIVWFQFLLLANLKLVIDELLGQRLIYAKRQLLNIQNSFHRYYSLIRLIKYINNSDQINKLMKRLQKQLAQVNQTMADRGIKAEQKQSLFHWHVTMKGPIESPYQDNEYILKVDFPSQYPFKFPHFKFSTPIYHPNIKDGEICREMIGEKQWLPNKKVTEILDTLLSMLSVPQIAYAINLQAAKDYKQDKQKFEAKVKALAQKSLQGQ